MVFAAALAIFRAQNKSVILTCALLEDLKLLVEVLRDKAVFVQIMSKGDKFL